ncbi:MAG: ATP-binding cassette domain-containing protein, partial [bacterium]|nr:ATP-binding cassette domain-containing protein [bacterium]
IVQVRGGAGVFPGLSVEENLLATMLSTKEEKDEIYRRVERVYDVFGVLREKRNQAAGDLSGGQQQMLAFGMGLMHEPEVLLIDELSLGLAPVVVQELLEVVEQLKVTGLTMIIVEQSLNVALSVAERAVFMEKGRVRFEGPAQELAERDDLVRAVFLGAEGG